MYVATILSLAAGFSLAAAQAAASTTVGAAASASDALASATITGGSIPSQCAGQSGNALGVCVLTLEGYNPAAASYLAPFATADEFQEALDDLDNDDNYQNAPDVSDLVGQITQIQSYLTDVSSDRRGYLSSVLAEVLSLQGTGAVAAVTTPASGSTLVTSAASSGASVTAMGSSHASQQTTGHTSGSTHASSTAASASAAATHSNAAAKPTGIAMAAAVGMVGGIAGLAFAL